jgi:hypothetical protein
MNTWPFPQDFQPIRTPIPFNPDNYEGAPL